MQTKTKLFKMEKAVKRMEKELRTLDLFAGVGGIRLGFEKAGFKTIFANDFDKTCKDTYDLNFSEPKLVVEDIWKVDINSIPKFEILLGGFPCQPFSIAGYRQGFKDEKDRGNLFFRIAEILEDRKPTAILLENVKNLKGHDNGKTFKIIEKTLHDLGYHLKSKVLNSMTHGNLPQNRERIFIVGFLDKNKAEAFDFPEEIDLKKSFKEVISREADDKYYYNDKPLYEKIKNDINSEDTIYQWRRKYVRANKKNVCPTLTANMGRGGHNVPIIKNHKGIRKLTPKECFLLQGFPESFKLPNIADSSLYHQAGNSVSVPVIERIAKNMMIVLNGGRISKQKLL
jgi:DNA (cytosine-5)-methyltransferase 1